MTTQWHPSFAKLLRPLLEGYYEVLTNVPVGDVPREADIVLVRRDSSRPPPFQGLWRELTEWNVLEYKAPTVAARFEHLDLLIELGLGVYRRLNEERKKQRHKLVGPSEMSFWYLANRIGKQFLSRASQALSNVTQYRDGVWCGHLLDRRIFLVSASQVAVEADTLPLHMLGLESHDKQLEAARLIVSQPMLWELFGGLLANFENLALTEIAIMAKSKSTRKRPLVRLDRLLEFYGKDEFNRGLKQMLTQMAPEEQDEVLKVCLSALQKPQQKRKALRQLMEALPAEEDESSKPNPKKD